MSANLKRGTKRPVALIDLAAVARYSKKMKTTDAVQLSRITLGVSMDSTVDLASGADQRLTLGGRLNFIDGNFSADDWKDCAGHRRQ